MYNLYGMTHTVWQLAYVRWAFFTQPIAALKAKILTAGISEMTPMRNIDVSIKMHIIIDEAFDCTVVEITSLTSFESIFDLARIDLSCDLKLKMVRSKI